MSEVFIFPDRMERQWRVFEADTRGALADLGCDRDTVDATARNLKPVFMKHARDESFTVVPDNREAAVAAVNAWVKGLVTGLLVEVALREAELILLRGERLP
ncbi:MAG: hypothetical protein KKA22_12930 [Gammaproteobacteria bacterium]|nr:hypothetical protein [Gammaproteobacteria bacterium]MBU1409040.1 hypothetical protein [Gammaproteobacteria bacterium]MBU1533539.1 hypothetical protein [Gammaproteobacteria bacterium]